jgi:hypothetical protein
MTTSRTTPAGVTGEPDPMFTARRAEIAAEEARLAALRDARLRLEQEVATLQQSVDERRSAQPGRRLPPETPLAPQAAPVPAIAALPPAQDAAGRQARVFVHHRANSAAASTAASEVAQNLRGGGFDVQGVRGSPFVPSTPVVRYFHEEDQAAAARLAGRLGRGWAIQDFRAFVPRPPPQTLEIWLSAD